MVRYLYHKNTHVSCICQRDLLASRIFFKSLSEFMAEQCRRTIHGAAALPVLILFRVQAGAGFAAFQVQVAALLGFGGHVACGAKAGSGGYFFALGHGNFFQPAVAPHAILRVGHFHHAAPQSVIRNGRSRYRRPPPLPVRRYNPCRCGCASPPGWGYTPAYSR